MLACRLCNHFRRVVVDEKFEPRPTQGSCTLFPKWESVNERHYCGQFNDSKRVDWREQAQGKTP